jgi:mRNA-degrading endonuclease RelE of RelBE toxin-antitoxin system
MVISKVANRFLSKADKATVKKMEKALGNIEKNEGYIEPLKKLQPGMGNHLYRYKMEHYRIIFERTSSGIVIKEIGTKNDMKMRRNGCI